MSINHWQTKLAAWTHDPAEKALILMRTREGHESGTVAELQQDIFGEVIPTEIDKVMHEADRWAAAADRPNFPSEEFTQKDGSAGQSDRWSSVRFHENPVLVHPLSGENLEIKESFRDVEAAAIAAVSVDHFRSLIQRDNNGAVDSRRTALAFWRFGPQLHSSQLKSLWQLLPADTRVPDHTIWSHLDLTSAFASAMAGSDDGQPALLTMSFGPVQDFIAQARSTSDLWAGSHLLSRMVWEGLKVICEECGPDAVVFPQLRGVALVDAWLQEEMKLPAHLFAAEDWRTQATDANPLFAAALPNKFTALVPASRVSELADAVTGRVRQWVKEETAAMLHMLLQEAGIPNAQELTCWQQLEQQLAGFPEIHWAAVEWSLAERDANNKANATQSALKNVLGSFIPEGESFLDSPAWKLLSKEIALDGATFFTPNPGILYPALYDLLDRLSAAAKVARPFSQLKQTGYRCTLTGEQEWLTTDREQLKIAPSKRKDVPTLWNKVSGKYGIKAGEHLGAIGMFKRLWPKRFTEWTHDLTGKPVNRFVVSTHTLAMASVLEQIAQGAQVSPDLAAKAEAADGVILPRKLARNLRGEALAIAKGLPALIDQARDSGDEKWRNQIEMELTLLNNGKKPEAYFAMLYMDGDKLGAWLADSWEGDEIARNKLKYRDTWHPMVRNKLQTRFSQQEQTLRPYLDSYRTVSPARHMAISAALNSFALNIARHVVEDCYMGKLLYAGGDDVMAMVAVKDLLPCMLTLRLAYSGVWPERPTPATDSLLRLDGMLMRRGHVQLDGNLHRVMGWKATASIGAVVAHHTAPLAMVLKELRAAEKDAKAAGRDAFALRVLKRGGGDESLSMPWLMAHQGWETMPELESTRMGLLMQLRDKLAEEGELSRRVAYLVNSWLPMLPNHDQYKDVGQYNTMIETTLAAQLGRQGGKGDFAAVLLRLADDGKPDNLKNNLRDIFATAEFFARNGRNTGGNA